MKKPFSVRVGDQEICVQDIKCALLQMDYEQVEAVLNFADKLLDELAEKEA